MNCKDLFIDIEHFDENNIIYVKPILFYKVVRNLGVYYKKDIKKQKIRIITPKMILPFDVKMFDNSYGKTYNMCVSFSTMTNLYNETEIKQFFRFIRKLDEVNEETVSSYQKSWGLPSLVYKKSLQRISKEYPHYMSINIPHDNKIGIIPTVYDENANKSTIDIIKKKSIVAVIMELTDLRFTDTEYRANWTVLQIRKFKPYSPIQEFFMTACFIFDEDDPEDVAYNRLIETYKKKLATPVYISVNAMASSVVPGPPPPPGPQPVRQQAPVVEQKNLFVPPSVSELLAARQVLKKTVTVEKNGIVRSEEKIQSEPVSETKKRRKKK